jgi:hypothetical protein
MQTTFDKPGASRLAARDALADRPALQVERALDGLAAFYATEAEARLAQTLAPACGTLLLGPAQAGWWAYRRDTAPWARRDRPEGRPWYGDRWFMAALGAVPMGLGIGLWVALSQPPALMPGLAIGAAGMLASGLAGAWLAGLVHRSPEHRRLDLLIRRQLAAGRWTLLYHDLPWEHQHAVLESARLCSLGWSAVAERRSS